MPYYAPMYVGYGWSDVGNLILVNSDDKDIVYD